MLATAAGAQDVRDAHVTVAVSAAGQPLANAVVHAGRIAGHTDAGGSVTLSLPPGRQLVVVRRLGFRADSLAVTLRAGVDTTVSISLAEQPTAVAPIVVTAARTEQRLEDVPLRVEVLAGEDIGEKNAVRPGDLTQMVAEIPGVRVQPTAPGSEGAALRVQGFRGQYTELLTDGLPLAGSSDAALSLAQTPPLDLAQIEVIKGAASALYGPSALGGVVNFITRRPPALAHPAERDAVLSISSRRDADVVSFVAQRLSPAWGYTLLAGAHDNAATDPDHDGWANVAQSRRGDVRPRLFWNAANGSTLLVTVGAAGDDRAGGTVPGRVTPAGTSFADRLTTRRGDAGAIGRFVLGPGTLLNVRSSVTEQHRSQTLGNVPERDRAGTAFGEASVTGTHGRVIWLAGGALRRDDYHNADVRGFDYAFITTSAFTQATISASDRISASVTGRCDHHNVYGTVCAPLAALLVRQPSASGGVWSERLSGGLGSYAPTPLTDETAVTGLSRVRPLRGPDAATSAWPLSYERARYATLDIAYHRGALDIAATGYASDILHPVTVQELPSGPYAEQLLNAPTPTRTRGVDIFAVYTGDPVSVTAFYGALRSREVSSAAFLTNEPAIFPPPPALPHIRDVPLNPSRRAGLDVALDVDETGTRVAVEAYYTGTQFIDQDPYRTTTHPYTVVEFLATQSVGHVQLFMSAENLTNVRQTNFDPLLLPARARNGRWTTDTWAPLDGRVVRLGLRTQF